VIGRWRRAFRGIERDGRFAESRYVLHRGLLGRGLMPEAMGAFVRFLSKKKTFTVWRRTTSSPTESPAV
jgi:RimJ/RimL family protein N-acetyltransferase